MFPIQQQETTTGRRHPLTLVASRQRKRRSIRSGGRQIHPPSSQGRVSASRSRLRQLSLRCAPLCPPLLQRRQPRPAAATAAAAPRLSTSLFFSHLLLRDVLPDDLRRGDAEDVARLARHGALHEEHVVADADNLSPRKTSVSSRQRTGRAQTRGVTADGFRASSFLTVTVSFPICPGILLSG